MRLASVVSAATLLLTHFELASADVSKVNGGYEIQSVGLFNYKFEVDFTKASALPPDLVISTSTVPASDAPYSRTHYASNVRFNINDSLSLLVPGRPSFDKDIPGAEITTSYEDILYGSVRTVLMASNASGTCHGAFFFRNDNQESDIEILTKNLSQLWLTNQANNKSVTETFVTVPSPATIASDYHEYRLDWMPDRTDFYVDGVQVASLKDNVPSVPGLWMWNNWASGGEWTGPPPTETSDMRIRSIEAYFNRTSIQTQDGNEAHPGLPTASSATHQASLTLPTATFFTSALLTSTLLASMLPTEALSRQSLELKDTTLITSGSRAPSEESSTVLLEKEPCARGNTAHDLSTV